jgi:hypothetical protein
MMNMNKATSVAAIVVLGFGLGCAKQAQAQSNPHAMHMSHESPAVPAVTFAELKMTTAQLETARRATDKYRDISQAEADGYRAIGPDVPGMGIHYVHVESAQGSTVRSVARGFDIEHPEILLYEKDAAAPGGYALVGVSYLLNAAADDDGQPKNPPFPKSLASWHRHSDLCVLSDRSVKTQLTAEQCQALGGQFTGLTQWMVHAWIWKDSPTGVFSGTNPTVR